MKPVKTSGRLVLALQFWEGDREAAMRNARRIADNEPTARTDVEFLFVSRFDCPHDVETIEYVRRKFPVATYICRRRGTGWPNGCNDVWCDLFCHHAMSQIGGKWADVKAVFSFEADCVPVARNWIDLLSAEWDRAAAQGKFVVGCWMPPPENGPLGHINGNAVFPPDIFERVPQVLGCSGSVGWDYAFAPAFEPYWFKTPLITNYYKALAVSDRDIERVSADGRRPALVHGVKDASVERYADRVLRKP